MELKVLSQMDGGRERLARELAALMKGPVWFGRHQRMLYATDASLYQMEPLGVGCPADAQEVQRVLAYCGREGVPVLVRCGGTSSAGQCTNRALVMDLSQLQRRVLKVDVPARTARVETGITVDEVNRRMAREGLMFAADPASSAQAGIGGCIGNNAAGARSIKYGRTSENMLGMKVVLSTGRTVWLGPGAGKTDAEARRLALGVMEIVLRHAATIRERFPKTIRRNAGYGLDLLLKQLENGAGADELDLTGLMCGSEGTLGVVVEAELKLHPLPAKRDLQVLVYETVEEAIAAVVGILETGPSAVELLDDVVLEAARKNAACAGIVEKLPKIRGKDAGAVLYVEYELEMDGPSENTGLRTAQTRGTPSAHGTPAELWKLRKSAEALLHGLSAHRKPHTFVEDNAIPVENLSRFVREFKQIVAKHGTTAAYYAHASVGVLHVRPMIDLHEQKDRLAMQAIAVDVADLARACGGVMSGEHGDGRVRGPLLERYFGTELMGAFAKVKRLFDPAGILNPGMIVGAGAIETITENLRVKSALVANRADAIDTCYGYEEGFAGALEMCNGAGFCRKIETGTMCPSFRGTLEERHSPRGRANALREAVMGGERATFGDQETLETLDLCLSCKACKTECPSSVDIAKMKGEYVAQGYRQNGIPLAARAFGHVRMLNQVGATMPRVANAVLGWGWVRGLLGQVLGVAQERRLPAFSTSLYEIAAKRVPTPPSAFGPQVRSRTQERGTDADEGVGTTPRVVLFADCFSTYNDAPIGLAAIKLLHAFGYEVMLPKVGCCGRAMLSTGLLDNARHTAEKTYAQLEPLLDDPEVKAIVFLEPSCLSAVKDDWLELKMNVPLDKRKKLARKSFLVEEFLDAQWDRHPRRPNFMLPEGRTPVLLHGHCHQKALWGDGTSSHFLRRIFGDQVKVLDSGCCGMAGSFGYLAKHYALSMKIGELSVFGPVREATEETRIVAPGTSCRHQIKDGTGRDAVHPVVLAAEMLK